MNCILLAVALKYVFLFIGDGMSTPHRMVADEYARAIGYGELAMNNLTYQSTTRTRSANALVTDSAAAATAIACGEKANNGSLGVSPTGERLESVAEFAHKRGKKVGVMTTVTITHATPAGFYAHRKSRSETYRIGLDLVDSGFDFFAGGGLGGMENSVKDELYRGNVFDLARNAGYTIVTNKIEFAALPPNSGKVWGVFSKGRLDYAIDWSDRQPSLADMVTKATELLEGPDGFFIMAEGGTVDYGAHANDAAAVLNDVIALDKAVKAALVFRDKHPDETLIVVTGDHETGGMAMGFAGTGYNFYVHLLARQKVSAESFSAEFTKLIKKRPELTFDEVLPMLKDRFGFVLNAADVKSADDKLMLLTKRDMADLKKAFANDIEFVKAGKKETTAHDVARRLKFAATAKRIIDNHASVGWSTGDHTALPTMTTAIGVGAERFTGFLENSDISRRLKDLLK